MKCSTLSPNIIKCRLDFFLVSQNLLSNVNNIEIISGFRSDHSAVKMDLSLNKNPKGPGLWKLNCSLLNETNYVDSIKSVIKEAADETLIPRSHYHD